MTDNKPAQPPAQPATNNVQPPPKPTIPPITYAQDGAIKPSGKQ